MKPSQFTTLLWGPSPPGLIHTWSLAQKRSYYHRSPHGTDMHAGQADAYLGVGLAHKDHGPSRRTRSELVIGIPGMWADLDADKVPAAAVALASIVIADPTITIDSGHGLHAWWLFDEPWIFASKAEQQAAAVMAAQWQKLHRDHFPALDSTADLARLMRLPGTRNDKRGERRPVDTVVTDGPRYPRAEVLARAREAGPVTVNLGAERAADATGGHAPARGALRAGGTLDADTLDLLLEQPEFAVLWNHERPEQHWSLSEYDMALTNLLAASGWTDQQLADLITHHRARYGETSKARRADYLRRTIAKARETQEREALMQRIRDRDLRRAA